MTGFKSKKAAAQDKLNDDDTQVYKDDGNALLIAYQSGYYDGKKAAANFLTTGEKHMIKLVAIRVLFNEEGKQTCDTGDETCHFYVSFQSSHWCNHCQRGITNSVPHRLCPLNDPAHMGPQEFASAVLAKFKEKNI